MNAANEKQPADVVRGRGSFWTHAQWADWSDRLAALLPEEYDGDAAQEALVERALADMVTRLAPYRLTSFAQEVVAASNERAERWRLRYVQAAAASARPIKRSTTASCATQRRRPTMADERQAEHERSADCVFPTCLIPNHWPTEVEVDAGGRDE